MTNADEKGEFMQGDLRGSVEELVKQREFWRKQSDAADARIAELVECLKDKNKRHDDLVVAHAELEAENHALREKAKWLEAGNRLAALKGEVLLSGFMTQGAMKEARSEKYKYTTVHKKQFNGAVPVVIRKRGE